jgi:hypothetical protein
LFLLRGRKEGRREGGGKGGKRGKGGKGKEFYLWCVFQGRVVREIVVDHQGVHFYFAAASLCGGGMKELERPIF